MAYLRPGLRYVWHRSAWPFGIGAGIGSTLAWTESQQGAASISPELLVHLGHCCEPGYIIVAVRADTFFPRRAPAALIANVGIAFW
jgi:hypothetical protein